MYAIKREESEGIRLCLVAEVNGIIIVILWLLSDRYLTIVDEMICVISTEQWRLHRRVGGYSFCV